MKQLISWTKDLSMGIKDIDEQHKHFVKILNSVYNKIEKGINEKKLSDDMNDLIEFARVHFSTEEDYFKKWNYMYSNEHMIEHEKLISKTLKFKDRFDNGEEIMTELLKFLKDWLENHLMTHDKKYSKYFKEKGFI